MEILNDPYLGNSSLGIPHNTSGLDFDEDFFHTLQKYHEFVLRTLLVLGIVGNIVNLFVLTRPTLRGVTFVYLFWLAMSDLCFLLVNFFVHFIYSIDSELRFHNYHVMFGLCRISFAGSNLFCGSSAFLVTVLTIDRHRAVLTPFKGVWGLPICTLLFKMLEGSSHGLHMFPGGSPLPTTPLRGAKTDGRGGLCLKRDSAMFANWLSNLADSRLSAPTQRFTAAS